MNPSFTTLARFTFLAAVATSSALAADSPAKARAGSDAVVLQEFIYEKAPYPSCHASTIVETDKRELVGQCESLLLGQAEPAGVGVVFGVTRGSLGCQPFGHVPLVRTRPFSKVLRSDPRAVRHCLVEAESIPDQQGGGMQHSSEILYEAADKLLQLLVVEVRD